MEETYTIEDLKAAYKAGFKVKVDMHSVLELGNDSNLCYRNFKEWLGSYNFAKMSITNRQVKTPILTDERSFVLAYHSGRAKHFIRNGNFKIKPLVLRYPDQLRGFTPPDKITVYLYCKYKDHHHYSEVLEIINSNPDCFKIVICNSKYNNLKDEVDCG